MGCETDALVSPKAKKGSSGQAISYGLLVACLVLLMQTALCLTRARADISLAQQEVEMPAVTQWMVSFPPPVVFLLAGAIGTVLTVKEILLRSTAIKLFLNLVATVALVLLFALAIQAVSVPVQ